MKYLYTTEKNNYEHFASGRVLYSLPGYTAFPVRLASEVIQRCFARLEQSGVQGPYTIYDPCCGAAYSLTALGFLHGDRLKSIYASDIQAEAIALAAKNLSLLTREGLQKRRGELSNLLELYQKASHRDALHSVDDLERMITFPHTLNVSCFLCDILSDDAVHSCSILHDHVDIVFVDVPYGNLVTWKSDYEHPLTLFFQKISQLIQSEQVVVAIVTDKMQKLPSTNLKKYESFKIGRRIVHVFQGFKD